MHGARFRERKTGEQSAPRRRCIHGDKPLDIAARPGDGEGSAGTSQALLFTSPRLRGEVDVRAK
jgi:hypothetical protein